MATIKDIAEACQVSKATVSRYINGSGYVSAEVGKRIEAKIKEMNYVPSATARNLSNRKNNVIGVVFPEVSNPFFAEVYKGISQVAEKNDLNIFYCDTDNNADKELKALAMLRSYEIQGLILTPATGGLYDHSYSKEFVDSVTSLNVPVVLLDRDVSYTNWDGIFIDNFKGAYELTKCLVDAGHRRIATITGDMDLMLSQERHNGYKCALGDSDIEIVDLLIEEGDFTTETAYRLMKKLVEGGQDFSAIFSPNNLTTLGILKAVNELDIRIPDDLSLVGFDDIELLEILNFNLTVVHRDNMAMGHKALELLISRMKNPGTTDVKRIIMEPEIIRRGSEIKV